MFTLIDRMLFSEVFKTLLVIVLVIVLLLFGNTLVRFLGDVAEGSLNLEIMLALVGVSMLKTLGTIIPPAFFFSILWVLGRMYRDSEMVALASIGVGTLRLYKAFLLSAIPVALLVGWLVLDIYPAAKAHARVLKLTQAAAVTLSAIQPGKFNEFNHGKIIIFAKEVNAEEGTLKDIFVQHQQHGKSGVVTAKRAAMETDPETGHRFIVLADGHRYQGEPHKAGFTMAEFSRYGLRVPELEAIKESNSPGSMSSRDLWESDDIRARAELQYRLSFPLAVLAFTLISVPLARQLPRQGVYGRLMFAVILYALYMNLQKITQNWMKDGQTAAWLGTWWLPVATGVIALLLIYYDAFRFSARRRKNRGNIE